MRQVRANTLHQSQYLTLDYQLKLIEGRSKLSIMKNKKTKCLDLKIGKSKS